MGNRCLIVSWDIGDEQTMMVANDILMLQTVNVIIQKMKKLQVLRR
uniref:Uncharacterized protein n=1 Tax=Setaria viridis TaxID=4556 RepID=A0A4U6TMM0_SETVI|nr:hypothetical protein SEVIR_8G232450v2 [Setaria viridis]